MLHQLKNIFFFIIGGGYSIRINVHTNNAMLHTLEVSESNLKKTGLYYIYECWCNPYFV